MNENKTVGSAADAGLPGDAVPGQTPGPAAANPAAKLTAKHGGMRGGRPREDGLVPGSPQAIEADREKECERGRQRRKKKKLEQEPDAIPSKGVGDAAEAETVDDNPPAGNAPVGMPPAGWTGDMVLPASNQAVLLVQDTRIARRKIRMAKANIPNPIIKEIAKDSEWNPAARENIALVAGEVVAKGLNFFRVPTSFKPGLDLLPSIVSIINSERRIEARLDELIRVQQEALNGGKPAEGKPA